MESADVKNKTATFFCVVTEKLAKTSKDKPKDENPENTKKKSNETEIEIDLPVCRICLQGGKKSGLVSPCLCSGSLVHLKCLELWLTRRKRDECEICQSPYKLKILRVDPHFSQFVCGNPVVAAEIVTFILLAVCILFALAFTSFVVTNLILAQEGAVVAVGMSLIFLHFLAVYSVCIYSRRKANIFKWKGFKIQHQRIKLFPLDPENTINKDNDNSNAVSMEKKSETGGDFESKGDLFFGQNTVIQMKDELTFAALLNSDPTNQKQNQQSSTFLNPCFANDF